MTAPIVDHVTRKLRDARKATSSGDDAAIYLAGDLVRFQGQLWQRVAEGKRRD